ncbi:MAG TPA: cell division protein FtsB, partial [Crenotrichaceae bacterium]|nr:cell division protein FtsB [Crenotrichaceae bacterium]
DKLTDKAEKIETRNQEMSLQISQMRTSMSAIESLARYDLGMIGKNEEFFLFDRP